MARRMIVTLVAALLATGCADSGALQRAVDRVDSSWGIANTDLKKTAGVRYYQLPKKRAFQAMLITLNELGYVVQNLSYETGFIVARAPIPTPLSKDEWAAVKRIEEPRMQRIAAQEVGSATAGLFKLHDANFETVVNVVMLERAHDIRISFGFLMRYTGPPTLLAYRQQPPPEAVKYAMRKTWDHFERVALVQQKTFE